jgi:integrase/recombinase XerC
MASVKAVLRPGRLNEKKEQPIYLRILIGENKLMYSIDKWVNPKYWNKKSGIVTPGDGNASMLNHAIDKKVREVKDIFLTLELEKKPLTVSNFQERYSGSNKNAVNYTIIEFIEHQNEILSQKVGKGTLKTYKQIIGNLKCFAPNATLADVDFDFLDRFEAYLKGCGLEQTTIYGRMKKLRTYIKLAKNKGLIENEPFKTYKLKDGVSSRTFLTDEELENLKNLHSVYAGEINAKDLFLFQCCTGLSYGDLMALQWDDIRHNEIIDLSRIKTGNQFTVPLIEQAKEILAKQNQDRETVFQNITNQKYNEHLNSIGGKLGFKKPLTTHVARHTFATKALSNGIPLEVVSSMLGHTTIKTTQIYAKILLKTKIDAMKKFKI